MKNFVYYTTGTEFVGKRKHVLFLEKSDILVSKFYNFDDLRDYLEQFKPAGIILTEDFDIDSVLSITDIPILLILKPGKNMVELMDKYFDKTIFFRYENDPINTILESAKLIQKLSEYKNSPQLD
jgi:hypothetical protein